ncbi:MAG: lytic transglycosylase domain-containing protein [Betaproteobacteria bacterium]|nr:lytic transglycosylase domain-containing protein [Betaproteobacteria bacterium]
MLAASLLGQGDRVQAEKLYSSASTGAIARLPEASLADARVALVVAGRQSLPAAAPPATRDPRAREVSRYMPMVRRAARKYGIDPWLLHSVIMAESGYDPHAVSPQGASGLMQLLPETAARMGVRDLFDPRQNIDGGARYLRNLLALFDNDVELALAAYNAGEGAVMRAGNRIPRMRETIAYVPKVLGHYRSARESDSFP